MKKIMHISVFMLGWLFADAVKKLMNGVTHIDSPTPIILLIGLTAIILISIFDKK